MSFPNRRWFYLRTVGGVAKYCSRPRLPDDATNPALARQRDEAAREETLRLLGEIT